MGKVMTAFFAATGHLIELRRTVQRNPLNGYTWPTFSVTVNSRPVYHGTLPGAWSFYRFVRGVA